MTKKKFDYEEIDVGFYDHIYQKKRVLEVLGIILNLILLEKK